MIRRKPSYFFLKQPNRFQYANKVENCRLSRSAGAGNKKAKTKVMLRFHINRGRKKIKRK